MGLWDAATWLGTQHTVGITHWLSSPSRQPSDNLPLRKISADAHRWKPEKKYDSLQKKQTAPCVPAQQAGPKASDSLMAVAL